MESRGGHNHHVRALQAACKVAKVKPVVSFHELHHAYASHPAQVGVDLLTISKLLGHADTRIAAKHYAHLADKTLAAAVTKRPAFTASPKQQENLRAVR
jgi:integrase